MRPGLHSSATSTPYAPIKDVELLYRHHLPTVIPKAPHLDHIEGGFITNVAHGCARTTVGPAGEILAKQAPTLLPEMALPDRV